MVALLALLGAMVPGGIILIWLGGRPRRRRTSPPSRLHLPRLTWRSPLVIGTGLAAVGLILAILTGWVVAIVLLPAAGVGLPYLLGKTESSADIARLSAMEEWTRSLASVLTAGAGLEQALSATLRSTPAPIRPDIARLSARLHARWTTPAAIQALADDLDDPTGDIIAANLLLGARRRGDGLATILEGLAESVALDVRARRQTEADAAKPRTTARWVTIITAIVLAALFLTGTYADPYRTGIGQVILLALLGMYAAVLVWMRRVATGPAPIRFLGRAAAPSPVGGSHWRKNRHARGPAATAPLGSGLVSRRVKRRSQTPTPLVGGAT
ncbi:MAG: type II secretion system F family protein [Propionibacteriaceae bacterium]|jgi:Flp pilus assembly protein TadB|nr:type II secretion system F family protein [Propionibacteriaceae bacterium]